MRATEMVTKLAMALACLLVVSACTESSHTDRTDPRHRTATRAEPAPNPAVTFPASYKTCTETFKLEIGTPRFDKCITSLSELEAQ